MSRDKKCLNITFLESYEIQIITKKNFKIFKNRPIFGEKTRGPSKNSNFFSSGQIFKFFFSKHSKYSRLSLEKIKNGRTRLVFELYDILSTLNFHVCLYEVKILSYDINLLHIGFINFNFKNVYEVTFFPSLKFLLNKVPPYFQICYIQRVRTSTYFIQVS